MANFWPYHGGCPFLLGWSVVRVSKGNQRYTSDPLRSNGYATSISGAIEALVLIHDELGHLAQLQHGWPI